MLNPNQGTWCTDGADTMQNTRTLTSSMCITPVRFTRSNLLRHAGLIWTFSDITDVCHPCSMSRPLAQSCVGAGEAEWRRLRTLGRTYYR